MHFRRALLALATSFAADKGFANRPNGHDGRVDAHDRQTDVDLEILDLLREGPKSAYRLAGALTHAGEEVGLEAMRSRLKALASRGLVVGSAAGHPTAAGGAEAPLADPWRITEEGRTLVEPEAGGGEGSLRPRSRPKGGGRARRGLLGANRDCDRDGGVRGVLAAYGDRRPGRHLGRYGAFEDPGQAKFREFYFRALGLG